jgi:hypothetical protein
MNSALLGFLENAALGTLSIGISSSEVVSHIGVAVTRAATDSSAEVWKYGPLQLTVENGKLRALKLNCLDRSPLPSSLREFEVPSPETTLYALIDVLDEHGIGWELDPTYTFGRQLCVRTNGNVRAYFDLDHRELQSLQA